MDNRITNAETTTSTPAIAKQMLGEVSTWASWAKRNKPQKIVAFTAGSLGYRYTIEPTLKSLGFLHTREERWDDCSPREQVLRMVDLMEYEEVVYYVFKHSRGYCSYVEVFFR